MASSVLVFPKKFLLLQYLLIIKLQEAATNSRSRKEWRFHKSDHLRLT